jgi:protocatechuate 3,4-dioxygenase beta subunit
MTENGKRHLLTRRQTLGIAGATGAALLLGSGRRPGLHGLIGEAGPVEQAQAATNCTLTAEKTQGPYWVDEKLNRSNVVSGQSGVPLTLNIGVYRADSSCSPYEGAVVDIGHCNADGLYSDESANGTSGQTFLRGYQVTDSNGAVQFTSIYPGWYSGRTVHIHVRVRTFSGSSTTYNFTTQIFFDESTNNAVLATSPYNTRGSRDTTNAQDSIYSSSLIAPVSGDTSSGYTATFSIGLSGLPASNSGSSSDSKVAASLLSAKVASTPRGQRVLKLRIKAQETISAVARLQRGGKLLARRKRSLKSGTHLLKVPIGAGVEAGAAQLKLSLGDSSGNSKKLHRSIHVPARR